jgi:diguanylate cyclase (GGDEF)-like protein
VGVASLGAWWAQPDQFDEITDFLRQRDLMQYAQRIMALVSSSAGTIPLTILVGQRQTFAALAIGVVGVAFTVGMMAYWLTRWPTRALSRTLVVAGALCVALWTVLQASAPIATLGCAAMAVTGGYIAVFHSGRVLMLNTALTVAITVTTVVRLAQETNSATAASGLGLIILLNASAPLTIRSLSRALVLYARRSHEDPLTGLLNRRGFVEAVTRRIDTPHPTHTHLSVLMVDLDDFKRVNDTFGHAVGDRTLLDVAAVLTRCCPPAAVVCRAGGEEFLVALTSSASPDETDRLGAELCARIGDLPYGVTASIGAARAGLGLLAGPDAGDRINRLVEVADDAMYTAKQQGGNQVRHGQT